MFISTDHVMVRCSSATNHSEWNNLKLLVVHTVHNSKLTNVQCRQKWSHIRILWTTKKNYIKQAVAMPARNAVENFSLNAVTAKSLQPIRNSSSKALKYKSVWFLMCNRNIRIQSVRESIKFYWYYACTTYLTNFSIVCSTYSMCCCLLVLTIGS